MADQREKVASRERNTDEGGLRGEPGLCGKQYFPRRKVYDSVGAESYVGVLKATFETSTKLSSYETSRSESTHEARFQLVFVSVDADTYCTSQWILTFALCNMCYKSSVLGAMADFYGVFNTVIYGPTVD